MFATNGDQEELKDNLKLLDMLIPPFELNPLWRNYGYKAKTILKKIKDHSWNYISNRNKEELRGISEGSNIDSEDIILLSLFIFTQSQADTIYNLIKIPNLEIYKINKSKIRKLFNCKTTKVKDEDENNNQNDN